MNRSEAIAQHIAQRIVRNTRKKWATLHADALEEEIKMAGPINPSNRIGSPADGFKTSRDVTNAGSKEPNATTGQSNASSTSPTTSGITASSQVNVGTVKVTGHKTLEGSNPGDHRAPNSGADTTDRFKTQAGPRGETMNTPNAGA